MSVKNDIELRISIVVYNTFINKIKQLLMMLSKIPINFEINIIDNSDKREILYFNKAFFRKLPVGYVKYIQMQNNIGFAKAHNLSLRESITTNTKYHLILNPDIHLKDEKVIPELITFLENNKEIGLLTPKILNLDNTVQYNCRLLPTPYILFARRFFRKKDINYLYELQFTGYNKIMEVPWVCGCFMLLRTEILKKVGLFDERFFLYMEDVDLSRRIYKVSKVIFYPYAQIYHEAQRGSYKSLKLLKYHTISAIKYFNKWGWFYDPEREKINKETLEKLGWRNFE